VWCTKLEAPPGWKEVSEVYTAQNMQEKNPSIKKHNTPWENETMFQKPKVRPTVIKMCAKKVARNWSIDSTPTCEVAVLAAFNDEVFIFNLDTQLNHG
jgi:hypothetical protein